MACLLKLSMLFVVWVGGVGCCGVGCGCVWFGVSDVFMCWCVFVICYYVCVTVL